MKILNLTRQKATPGQREAGVFDPDALTKAEIVRLLTFEKPPTRREMSTRADMLAEIVEIVRCDCDLVMVGGAPFFMSTLESALIKHDLTPVYAFSRWESVDEVQPDGSVCSVSVLKHIGFIPR